MMKFIIFKIIPLIRKFNFFKMMKFIIFKNHLSNKEIQFFKNDEIYNFQKFSSPVKNNVAYRTVL